MSIEILEKAPVAEQVTPVKAIIEVRRQITSDRQLRYCRIKKNNILIASDVYISPTGDCQTFSISAVNNFLPSAEPGLDVEILARCFQAIGHKNQLLVNICTDTNTMERFEEIFNGYITIEQNYTSTRGSAMTMFLVKTTPLLRWLEENNKTGKIKYYDDKA